MWALSGRAHTLTIDFLVDGEFVVAQSAEFVLRDHVGDVLLTGPLTAGGTSTEIEIADVHNILSLGAVYQPRYLNIFFRANGRSYRIDRSYRIHKFIPMTATPADVRSELGLDESEMPDGQIDLVGAYIGLVVSYVELDQKLVAGGWDTILANRAITLRAALDRVHSLSLRAGSVLKSEESTFQRQEFDVAGLSTLLASELDGVLATLRGIEIQGPALLRKATPIDALTGA